jgi:HEAT repeat protein
MIAGRARRAAWIALPVLMAAALSAGAVERALIKSMDAEQLIRILAQDPDADSRKYAAEVLASWHSEKSYPALATAAVGDPVPGVRLAALRALDEAGGLFKAPEALRGAMADADPGIRETAVLLAARRRVPGMGGTICSLLADPDEDLRETALFGLAAYKDPETAACVLERIPGNADVGQQVRYVRVVREIGSKAAAVPLAKIVVDTAPAVQAESLLAFLAFGDPAVVPFLETMRDQTKGGRLRSQIQTTITALTP